jgi:SH3-like domain-containing protein
MQIDMSNQSGDSLTTLVTAIARRMALCAFISIVGVNIAIAQADLPTTSDAMPKKVSVEQQYQIELDRWMLQAYEGDRDAQFKVGVLFTNNQFNSADYEQAVYWYKQAARQGHALSQYNLGHQYLTGLGVKRSENDAMSWWLKAAEQDHPLAQFNVGRGYYLGIGLDEDHSQSEYWFRRAANNNEPKSIEILEQLGWSQTGKDNAPTTASPTPDITDTETVATVDTPEPIASTAKDPTENTSVKADTPATTNDIKGKEIAVYTDPSKRAVLISILKDHTNLSIVKRASEWTRVRNKTGLPVWVHQNFVSVKDSKGTINGERVNARSVPLIAKGTIVGRLENGQSVAILDKRSEWYRVKSPATFEGWVKSNELVANNATNTRDAITTNEADTKPDEPSNAAKKTPTSSSESTTATYENTNDWLFSQPPTNFTLQLASFDDPKTVALFESRKKFINNPDLHRFTAASKKMQWTYFLYGSYADKELAIDSRTKIDQKRAWVRSFDKLQQNRCLAWKKQIPTPKMLNKYCS